MYTDVYEYMYIYQSIIILIIPINNPYLMVKLVKYSSLIFKKPFKAKDLICYEILECGY